MKDVKVQKFTPPAEAKGRVKRTGAGGLKDRAHGCGYGAKSSRIKGKASAKGMKGKAY